MNNQARLLYVEDDLTLSFVTRDNLEMHGFVIDYCEDGEQAYQLFLANRYDLCILDVMLPKMDGFRLAEKIRAIHADVPIIFLTARSTKDDRIHGLRLGADDYITKPFSIEELILKINVFLRRSGQQPTEMVSGKISIGAYEYDKANLSLRAGEHTRQLTQREAELLEFLFDHCNSIVRRDDLLIRIWGDDHYFVSRSLDVFISRLRKYLKEDPHILIESIHNVGYRMTIRKDP